MKFQNIYSPTRGRFEPTRGRFEPTRGRFEDCFETAPHAECNELTTYVV